MGCLPGTLPWSNGSLLARTDLTGGEARQQVSEEARENEDGFRAYVELVSDPVFEALPGRR
jgi:hypothetical protein